LTDKHMNTLRMLFVSIVFPSSEKCFVINCQDRWNVLNPKIRNIDWYSRYVP